MKVVRISENELHDMIVESVKRSLQQEGAFGDFLKSSGKGLKNVGNYAISRIIQGNGEHEIGGDPNEKKYEEIYQAGYGEGKSGTPNDTHEKYLQSRQKKEEPTNTSSETN